MRPNEKHWDTKSYRHVALQINFYGSCKFTEYPSLLLNRQMSQSRKMEALDFSFHHTHLKFYVYIYRAVRDEVRCHSQFNYLIRVVLQLNVINTWFAYSILSHFVRLKCGANGH
jgi:hypothetical protein